MNNTLTMTAEQTVAMDALLMAGAVKYIHTGGGWALRAMVFLPEFDGTFTVRRGYGSFVATAARVCEWLAGGVEDLRS